MHQATLKVGKLQILGSRIMLERIESNKSLTSLAEENEGARNLMD